MESEFGPDRLLPSGVQLANGDAALNLAPQIREFAREYFGTQSIVWHQHANHALSSQVACLNFLMPLATRPVPLSELVGRALGIAPPEMLPVEDGPGGAAVLCRVRVDRSGRLSLGMA